MGGGSNCELCTFIDDEVKEMDRLVLRVRRVRRKAQGAPQGEAHTLEEAEHRCQSADMRVSGPLHSGSLEKKMSGGRRELTGSQVIYRS